MSKSKDLFQKPLFAFILVFLFAQSTSCQSRLVPSKAPSLAGGREQSPPDMDAAMVSFFSGSWECSGEFSNGKKIEADVTFTPDLDGRWLRYAHLDRPPNRFKASAMWGVDKASGKLISVMQDNFGGARLFLSSGWSNHAIVFESGELLSKPPRQERFSYSQESPLTFRMKYEVKSLAGQWNLGDYIVCKKRS